MITEERKTYPTARDGSIASVRGHYSITTHAKQLLKYPKDWEDVTDLPTQLDVCRFMAKMYRDDTGTIIARPFPKFFNLDETDDTKLTALPMEVPTITEKLDGSLGIQYYDGDTPCIATRGSFTGDQAAWATAWMAKTGLTRADFLPNHTYLYEIIYPENRIVIDYGTRAELVLLAVIDTETGHEVDLNHESARLGFSLPAWHTQSIDALSRTLATLPASEEGYVAYYASTGLRVKMKGEEYVRLHRLITTFSSRHIWECLLAGQDLDAMMGAVPEAFRAWVTQTVADLRAAHAARLAEGQRVYALVKDVPTRKDQAALLQSQYPEIKSVVFTLLDGRDPTTQIWMSLKPAFAKPFYQSADHTGTEVLP